MVALKCIAALLIAVLCSAVTAQTAPPPVAADDVATTASLQRWLDELFVLPANAAELDPDVRTAAAALREQALAIAIPLIPHWVAEERRRVVAANDARRIAPRLQRRIANELALWRVDGGDGSGYRSAMQALWHGDGACSVFDATSSFAAAVLMLQRLPVAHRGAALAAERESLQRWGSRRSGALSAPLPSAYAAQDAAIKAVLDGGQAKPAWAPLMTLSLASDNDEHLRYRGQRFMRCLTAQWWARSGAPAAQADNLLRHAQVMRGDEFWQARSAAANTNSDYPRDAKAHEVTGVVTVRADVDAQGRVLRAEVVARRIAVAGIRDNPPVAFEHLLDAPSIERARGNALKPDASRLKDGVASVEVNFDWNLK